MTLIYTRPVGDNPGLHALIVGVSAYAYLPGGGGPETEYAFGMTQLTSTAISAWKIAQWLIDHEDQLAVPLATVRMVLSPSERELQRGLKDQPNVVGVDPATLEKFEAEANDWRKDSAAHGDGYTFFYFAGHGLRRSSSNDAVMLLTDHGASPNRMLRNDVEVANVIDGMAPTNSRPNIARNQLYFIDSCRLMPEEFDKFLNLSRQKELSVDNVFDVEVSAVEDRAKHVYYAAIPGKGAPADGQRQTFFSMGLLECLNRLGADCNSSTKRWSVSAQRLSNALTEYFKMLKNDLGIEQAFEPDPGQDCEIYFLDTAPEIDLEVIVEPPGAYKNTKLQFYDNHGDQVKGLPDPPFKHRLQAGVYKITCELDPPHERFTRCESEYDDGYEPFWPPNRHVLRISCQ